MATFPYLKTPLEIRCQIARAGRVREFLVLAKIDNQLPQNNDEYRRKFIHSILREKMDAEVLDVAYWCSRSRSVKVSFEGENAERYYEDILLEGLPSTTGETSIGDSDALWIEGYYETLYPFCKQHLTTYSSQFLNGADYAPTDKEINYMVRAGFLVAAMIASSSPENLDFYNYITERLSCPELFQVIQFMLWLQEKFHECKLTNSLTIYLYLRSVFVKYLISISIRD